MENKPKIERCKSSHLHYDRENKKEVRVCWRTDEDKVITEEICENCPHFNSRYIEFPITVNDTEHEHIKYNKDSWHCKMGSLVKIRPCGDEYEGKTYVGFYIGDLPLQTTGLFNEETGIYKVGLFDNSAIFVPELHKIIFGMESWWGEIKSLEDFKEISNEDIENVWYVQLAKALNSNPK